MRWLWIALGLFSTGLGFAGLALPLLPGTPFFLLAAYAFARSSPRLLAWLHRLPHVGPMIADYRAGLGIPRRTKWLAASVAALAITTSAALAPSAWAKVGILSLGAVGVGFVLFRVPTREVVLAERAEADPAAADG